MPRRAGFYFDGFNVYHAIDGLGAPHLKWMSYLRLARCLSRRDESVEFVKVFTAFPGHVPRSIRRFRAFRAATKASGVIWIEGNFKKSPRRCKVCKQEYVGNEEKGTDVSIGIHLVTDCIDGLLDVAYIVSTDSDFTPAVEMVLARRLPVEIVTVATPGRAHCKKMRTLADRKAKVTRDLVEDCLMPQSVYGPDGNLAATRPAKYDPPA